MIQYFLLARPKVTHSRVDWLLGVSDNLRHVLSVGAVNDNVSLDVPLHYLLVDPEIRVLLADVLRVYADHDVREEELVVRVVGPQILQALMVLDFAIDDLWKLHLKIFLLEGALHIESRDLEVAPEGKRASVVALQKLGMSVHDLGLDFL